MEMLDRLKMLLAIEGEESDELLAFLLEASAQRVKSYCHLSSVIPELELVIVRFAADLWRAKGYGTEQQPAVAAVTRGDVSTRFAVSAADGAEETALFSVYAAELQAYRKLG